MLLNRGSIKMKSLFLRANWPGKQPLDNRHPCDGGYDYDLYCGEGETETHEDVWRWFWEEQHVTQIFYLD